MALSLVVVTAVVPAESEEIFSLFLTEAGAAGTEATRAAGDRIRLRAWLPGDRSDRADAWRRAFAERYPHAPPPIDLRVELEEERDWEEEWKRHHRPREIGERFLVCPPFDVPEEPSPDRILLVIEPAQAFGTGDHPSTRLALLHLEAFVGSLPAPPSSMAEVGAGSGILAIAGRLLGIRRVFLAENDPVPHLEIPGNFARNGLAPPDGLVLGSAADLPGRFPLVIANLDFDIHLAIARELTGLLEPEGSLILSGIREAEGDAVRSRFRELRLTPAEERSEEGWLSFRFVR